MMATRPTSEAGRTDWAVVSVALGGGILAALQVGKAMVGLPTVRADLGMSLTLAGVLLSAYTYVGAALGGVAGGLVDKLGQSRVLVAALAALAMASALGAVSPGTGLLVASRVLEGLGFMGSVVAAPALVSRAAGASHRSLAMGLWGIYMPAGQLLAMIVGPGLLTALGWRGFWWANAALLGGYAVLAALVVRRVDRRPGPAPNPAAAPGPAGPDRAAAPGPAGPDRAAAPEPAASPEPPQPTRPGGSLAALRPVVPVALTFGLYSLQYLAVVGFLPTIYQANGLSQAVAATLAGIVIAGNIVGNVVAGGLLHRGAGPGSLAMLALAVMAATAVLIYWPAAPLPLAFTAAVTFATFGGLLPASVFAAVPRLAPSPELTGPANGLVVQVSNTGSIIGPPLVAAVASRMGGWSYSPFVLCTAAGLGIMAASVVRRRELTSARGVR